MSTASVTIAEERTSPVGQITWQLMVVDAGDAPLAGAEVVVSLEGDGSLASGFSSKQIKREIDAEGHARVTWYRRSIYGRDVKATLSVASDRDDAKIDLLQLTPEQASQGAWISWAPRRGLFR
jgi:hypothetical protein